MKIIHKKNEIKESTPLNFFSRSKTAYILKLTS